MQMIFDPFLSSDVQAAFDRVALGDLVVNHPPRPLENWVSIVKARARRASKDLNAGRGSEGGARSGRYNNAIDAVRTEFVEKRAAEYARVRFLDLQACWGVFTSRIDGANSAHAAQTYLAPESMHYADIRANEYGRRGDVSRSMSVAADGKSVTVRLGARLSRGSNKRVDSGIEVGPLVYWAYDDPESLAVRDWEMNVYPKLFANAGADGRSSAPIDQVEWDVVGNGVHIWRQGREAAR